MLTSKSSVVIGVLLTTLGIACGGTDDTTSDAEGVSVADLKAYWADYRKLDVSDLTRMVGAFATPVLNDKLAFGGVAARFDGPTVYAAHPEKNRLLPNGAEPRDLGAIVDGLATRFGEKELGTEVNRTRLETLTSGADGFFVESAFQIRAGIDHGWSFDSSGLLPGANLSVGFDAGASLMTRVILAAPEASIARFMEAPLEAAKAGRGFVLPESIEHIRAMKPGEMFALRGTGRLGANLGVGIPVLSAEPTGGMVYRVVVSGGVSAVIAGQLDVQLVRLKGDEVVVDVGVENASSVTVRASISDGWGIKGICDDGESCLRPARLGPVKVDLQRLVEKSMEKQLNRHLSFTATAAASAQKARVGVSRMRFHLDRGDPQEVERALQQALKLDTRLAFALSHRDAAQPDRAAVSVELDAIRSSTSVATSFGFELMGMNLYHRAVIEKKGSFVVQTPEGARAILFDSLDKQRKLFQSEHGYTRTGISALTVSREGVSAEANLFVQTRVSDSHMDDDLLIDSADAVLSALAPEALDDLDATGNTMERLVFDTCFAPQPDGSTPDPDCDLRLLAGSQIKTLRADGIAAATRKFEHLPEDFRALARQAAETRLALQSVHISRGLEGPSVSFTLDYRLDDKALGTLMSRSGEDYRAALTRYIAAVRTERRHIGHKNGKTRRGSVVEVENDYRAEIAKMVKTLEDHAASYRAIADAEKLLPRVLEGKQFIPTPVGIRFAVDKEDNELYESAAMESLARDRSLVAQRLFDDLKSAASSISTPHYDENLVAYPLLALVPPRNLQVEIQLDAVLGDGVFQSPERFQRAGFKSVSAAAKGTDVSMIDAGIFDIGAILADVR